MSLAAARAAGIPVVADSTELTTLVGTSAGERSREGSVASSGEYSDHESQKIHQDHKVCYATRSTDGVKFSLDGFIVLLINLLILTPNLKTKQNTVV